MDGLRGGRGASILLLEHSASSRSVGVGTMLPSDPLNFGFGGLQVPPKRGPSSLVRRMPLSSLRGDPSTTTRRTSTQGALKDTETPRIRERDWSTSWVPFTRAQFRRPCQSGCTVSPVENASLVSSPCHSRNYRSLILRASYLTPRPHFHNIKPHFVETRLPQGP